MYLGLDLSLTGTGLCLIHSDYSINNTKLISNPLTDEITRLFLNQNDLIAFIEEVKGKIKLCCIEGPALDARNGGRIFQIGEWTGVAKLVLYTLNIPFIIAVPSQLKKYISGTGKGVKKELIMLDIYKKYSVELRDNNIADAYVLSRIARDYDFLLHSPDKLTDIFKYQQEVLKALHITNSSTKQHKII